MTRYTCSTHTHTPTHTHTQSVLSLAAHQGNNVILQGVNLTWNLQCCVHGSEPHFKNYLPSSLCYEIHKKRILCSKTQRGFVKRWGFDMDGPQVGPHQWIVTCTVTHRGCGLSLPMRWLMNFPANGRKRTWDAEAVPAITAGLHQPFITARLKHCNIMWEVPQL